MIRRRIFIFHATEAARHARENGFDAATANEIDEEIISAAKNAAQAWADQLGELREKQKGV